VVCKVDGRNDALFDDFAAAMRELCAADEAAQPRLVAEFLTAAAHRQQTQPSASHQGDPMTTTTFQARTLQRSPVMGALINQEVTFC